MNQLLSVFPLGLVGITTSPMSQGLLLAGTNHAPALEGLPYCLHPAFHPVLRKAKRKRRQQQLPPQAVLGEIH